MSRRGIHKDTLVGVIDNLAFESFDYVLTLNLTKSWERLPEPKIFGDYLRIERLKAGMQVRELAKKLRVSSDTVLNWELRGNSPDYAFVRRLKTVFPRLRSICPSLIYSQQYPKDPKALGERVRKRRLELDFSQREFAAQLEVCVDVVRDWEAGRTRKNDVAFEGKLMKKLDQLSAKSEK